MTLSSTLRFYARVLGYFREAAGRVALNFVMTGAAVLLGVLQPFPIAILFDSVFGQKRVDAWEYRLFFRFAPASVPKQVIALAAVALLLRVAQEVLKMAQTLLAIKVGYDGLLRVRCDLFRKLQELSLAYHKSQPQGDAIYRLSHDTFGFQTILNVLVQTILVSSITLGCMLWVMLSLSWRLTLVALAVVPPLWWTTRRYGRIFRDKSTAASEVESKLTTAIQRSVSSIGLVQAFGREADEFSRFRDTARSSVRTWLELHRREVWYWMLIGMIFAAGGAFMFGYGGWMVWRDQYGPRPSPAGLTVGMLWVFLNYLNQLYDPLNRLSGSGASVQTAAAGVRRVFEVLDREPGISDAPDALALPRQPRTLELRGVGFEYRTGEPVLRDVSVTIPPGQMVAFVGSSGVGKTTLLNLLPRFYDPTSGAVCLDGIDARKVKVRDLRRHVALVLQDNIVLPTTVAENIAYGRPDATGAQIRQAAAAAGAAAFIEKLPRQYETLVSESGGNLSGGERQRIGIARALLTEAPLLVLDEPTGALDTQNERMILETLRGLNRQRTVILVSHRLSTVADCDRIFVLDEGTIAEQGTHEELLAKGGLYCVMARRQLKLLDLQEYSI